MKEIRTVEAPAPIGPYSQAIESNGFVFVSGQIPIDPTTGKLVEGNIEVQTRQVINNLRSILKSADVGLCDVVKTTMYLRNIENFKAANDVYNREFESDPKPAREIIQGIIPLNAEIEISCIARK